MKLTIRELGSIFLFEDILEELAEVEEKAKIADQNLKKVLEELGF